MAGRVVTWSDDTVEPVSFDEDAFRRKTVQSLARKNKVDNPGCSPSVFLTLTGLLVCTAALCIGIPVFYVQWRRYGVLWGGYLEWHCTLISCQLRYTYPGAHRTSGMRNFILRHAKKWFAQSRWEAVQIWIQDFTDGKAEDFPPLFDLSLCTDKSIQSWLFSGFCTTSSQYNKLIGGTIWSVVMRASRTGLALVVLSIVLSVVVFVFVAVDHQVFKKDKKPRWAVSAVKTGKFRPFAKVAAGLLPICTAICVLQYRVSIHSLEQAGGVCKQALSLLAQESGEVQMPWGTLWYLLISLVQVALTIGFLRGPLRKPHDPLAMDLVDVQVELQRRQREDSLNAEQEQPAPGASSSAPPFALPLAPPLASPPLASPRAGAPCQSLAVGAPIRSALPGGAASSHPPGYARPPNMLWKGKGKGWPGKGFGPRPGPRAPSPALHWWGPKGAF